MSKSVPSRERTSYQTLSDGSRTFRHSGIIVRPKAILFDKGRKRLVVVEAAIAADPRASTVVDQTSAQITALIVLRSLRRELPYRINVRLYLAYPGNVQTELDVNLKAAAQVIRAYRRRQRLRDRLTRRRDRIPCIPGQALAYTLSTMPEWSLTEGGYGHG